MWSNGVSKIDMLVSQFYFLQHDQNKAIIHKWWLDFALMGMK